jgi:predicted RNA-binding Zn-ribbon protein involved in translation (DUF1610 family)
MEQDENQEEIKPSSTAKFVCPNCGRISQDDVVFLCNNCGHDKLIYKEGIYMCPKCLKKGDNFECMLCGSKEVVMAFKKKKKS